MDFKVCGTTKGITAMQMDLRLPQGMTLVEAAMSDRATASHQVAFSQLANGNYRLLVASSACKAFAGNDGTVLTLTLAGTPSGEGYLSNIVLATPTATCYSIEGINLNFIPTGIDNVYYSARIYSEGGNIVIDSPSDGTAQIVLPNGMSQTAKVMRGRNGYPSTTQGVVIVKTGTEIKKLQLKYSSF